MIRPIQTFVISWLIHPSLGGPTTVNAATGHEGPYTEIILRSLSAHRGVNGAPPYEVLIKVLV